MTRPLNLPLLPVLLMPLVTNAATWHVDASVPESGDGTSWATAFRTIQEGIDASSDGDTVVVGEGLYNGAARFRGKNITLTSRDPCDADVVLWRNPSLVYERDAVGLTHAVGIGGTR